MSKHILISNYIDDLTKKDALKYTFSNVFYLIDGNKSAEDFIEVSGKYNTLFFYGISSFYNRIIAKTKNKKIKIIIDKDIPSFNVDELKELYELTKNKKINEFIFTYKSTYDAFKIKNKKMLYLDLDKDDINKCKKKNSLGLISIVNTYSSSFYNALSAVSLTNFDLRVKNPCEVNELFLSKYKIKLKKYKNIEENILNLKIDFYNNDGLDFIKSMDSGTLCLVGNNEFLKDYDELSKFLMVNGDDNVEEIYSKIFLALENKDEIFKLYKLFRADYSLKAKELLEKVLE